MISPVSKHYDIDRKTVTLFFNDRDSMECYLRGGICWPVSHENENGIIDISGYALMAGQDIKTGDVWVFEQTNWVTIDNILDKEYNTIRYLGLSHWFNKLWSDYFAGSFFWQQPDELAKRFRLQILRSQMINPKPRFIEVPYSRGEQASRTDLINAIWINVKAGKLFREGNTILENQLAMIKSGKGDRLLPAVHALGCCLLGIERYPWRAPVQRPIREILIAA